MTELNLNQTELAKLTFISRSHLASIINNKVTNPKAITACRLAIALKVEVGWLIGGDDWLSGVKHEKAIK